MAMLNQKIDLSTRRQIVEEFAKLIVKIDNKTDFDELIQELK
jgi:hypothetical protein